MFLYYRGHIHVLKMQYSSDVIVHDLYIVVLVAHKYTMLHFNYYQYTTWLNAAHTSVLVFAYLEAVTGLLSVPDGVR